MKRTVLAISFWLPLLSNAQNSYLKVPVDFFDKKAVSHIVDSLNQKKKLSKFLVYQRPDTGNEILTYLVCKKEEGGTWLWIISRDTVVESKSLNQQAIFSYKSIAATGATEEEDKLKFKPPMLSVVKNEVVIYSDNETKKKFYFEYGDNVTTYEPLPNKDVYRRKWLDVIRKTIL